MCVRMAPLLIQTADVLRRNLFCGLPATKTAKMVKNRPFLGVFVILKFEGVVVRDINLIAKSGMVRLCFLFNNRLIWVKL